MVSSCSWRDCHELCGYSAHLALKIRSSVKSLHGRFLRFLRRVVESRLCTDCLMHQQVDPFNHMHQKEKDRSKNRMCKRAFYQACKYRVLVAFPAPLEIHLSTSWQVRVGNYRKNNKETILKQQINIIYIFSFISDSESKIKIKLSLVTAQIVKLMKKLAMVKICHVSKQTESRYPRLPLSFNHEVPFWLCLVYVVFDSFSKNCDY